MNIDLPTQYDPKSVEKPVYEKWIAAKAFHAVPDARPVDKRFSIVIPPPNVTGALHLGHAINGTIQDILTRYHRMKGDNTLWMPGIDHAGIATQAVVEKTIFEKEKKSRHDLGREELVRRIWEWKEQYGNRILSQQAQLGASCDWDRTRFTLDQVCAKAVREAFFKMFKDGLIFRGKRLVNWDTHLQTAVADDEIYHETVKGQLTSIKYPIDDGTGNWKLETGNFLIVATTRPETMLGDTAVAVHPDDPRYTHLHGKHVILPLVGRKIPVICDGQLVDPKFGTGVVKVTPAHDPNDYATGMRHNLEQINLLTADGKVNENGQGEFLGKKYSYVGLKFATAARKQVLADLESLGLIAEAKVHEHEVGHSDRSKTPIEPYLSDQWFVRMGDIQVRSTGFSLPADAPASETITLANGQKSSGLAQAAMDAVLDGRVKITPERYAKGYLDWLGQKRDWCISRQLWWGHRIPVWSRPKWEGENYSIPAVRAYFEKYVFAPCLNNDEKKIADAMAGFEAVYTEGFLHICFLDPAVESAVKEMISGKMGYTQDPDVLDTWFSSALWPISTMGWPDTGTSPAPQDQLLNYFYPTSVLSTARDILTLWVARMVMFGLYCKGDVPFRQVFVHAVIQDGNGQTMSKSKGNGVDPVDIINSHGADALRFTLAQMSTDTQDIRMPVVKDPKTGVNTSPKFDIGRNFANKIWNASRYILSNIDESTARALRGNARPSPSTLEDRWILSRLNATVQTAETSINNFRFSDLANALYQFFWTDLCDWYLEISKARIKSGDSTVQSILLHCIETALKLLHPVMPFISEEIWSKLPARESALVITPFPTADAALINPAAESQLALIQEVTSAIRELINAYPAAKGKDAVIKTASPKIAETIAASRNIIEPLAGVKLAEISPTAAKPADAAVRVRAEMEIYIAGVIDKAAETAKLTKRKTELEGLIPPARAKLANEAAIAKVPAKVVQGWRDQLAKYEEELAAIEKNLAELGA